MIVEKILYLYNRQQVKQILLSSIEIQQVVILHGQIGLE